jgi:hypothetical protein
MPLPKRESVDREARQSLPSIERSQADRSPTSPASRAASGPYWQPCAKAQMR